MISELLEMGNLTYATLQEDCVLRATYPSVTDEPLRRTMYARRNRFMELIFIEDLTGKHPERYPKPKDPLIRRDKFRIILEDSLSEATAIREIEAAGLVEVQKGAEDPETLLRVWVKGK